MLSFVVRSRLLRSHTTWPAKRRSWPPPERPTLRETAQRRQSRRNCRTNWKSANKTHRRWALQLQRLWAHHYVNIMSNNPKRKWAAILFQSIRVWVSVAWLMSDWMPLLLFSESFLFFLLPESSSVWFISCLRKKNKTLSRLMWFMCDWRDRRRRSQ